MSGESAVNTEITKIELFCNGEKVSEEDNLEAFVDDSLEFTAKVYTPENEDGYDYSFDQPAIHTDDGTIRLNWSSSNASVAKVNRGNVGISSAGMAYISAQAVGTMTMSDVIEINAQARPVQLLELSIGGVQQLEVGQTAYLKAIITPMNATDKEVVWKSEDPSVLEVNSYGMITAKSPGKTRITLAPKADPGFSFSSEIEVISIPIKSIRIEKGSAQKAENGKYIFHSEQAVEDGGEIRIKDFITERGFYIRTTVNSDAAEKDMGFNEDYVTGMSVREVTWDFDGLEDVNRVFYVSLNAMASSKSTLWFYGLGENDASVSVSVRTLENGWLTDAEGHRMYYSEGEALTGVQKINRDFYYFGDDGYMQTGWQTVGGKTYFFGEYGSALLGWQEIDGNTYFFEMDGTMLTGWGDVSDSRFYFGSDGIMRTGWQKIGGKWYYLASGLMTTGWKKLSNKWYYFGTDGIMRTGWQKVGKSWYHFGTDGIMRTGWQKVGKSWYYFGTDGVMRTGWQKVGKSWYYFGTDGVLRTGWQKVGKSWYYFGTNGVMRTGWQKIGKSWYFLKDGVMFTGWIKSGGKWYYFNASGVMVTGSVKIGNKTYHFNSSGECLNP